MSAIGHLFSRLGRSIPTQLSDWDARVGNWCFEYALTYSSARLSEINLDLAVYVFDHSSERVTLAYAVSVPQLHERDGARMRGFPDVNVGVRQLLGRNAFPADRGHFLGHASGGTLDINLFPQNRRLNRGWSEEGRRYRAMERYVARHPGSFFYHRPLYADDTWIPSRLEYGVLQENVNWWSETFANRSDARSPAV